MQQTFSIATGLLTAHNLNPKCSFNRPIILLYFIPESLAVAIFYFFLLRDVIISGDVM